jgi:hypothetical protein
VLANGRNLTAVLKGFAEARNNGNVNTGDAALTLANAMRTNAVMSSAFDNRTTTSLYAGVPKMAAQNLYEINKRRRREDSLYAFS